MKFFYHLSRGIFINNTFYENIFYYWIILNIILKEFYDKSKVGKKIKNKIFSSSLIIKYLWNLFKSKKKKKPAKEAYFLSSFKIIATPKSANFTIPSDVINILAPLISLWTTP